MELASFSVEVASFSVELVLLIQLLLLNFVIALLVQLRLLNFVLALLIHLRSLNVVLALVLALLSQLPCYERLASLPLRVEMHRLVAVLLAVSVAVLLAVSASQSLLDFHGIDLCECQWVAVHEANCLHHYLVHDLDCQWVSVHENFLLDCHES